MIRKKIIFNKTVKLFHLMIYSILIGIIVLGLVMIMGNLTKEYELPYQFYTIRTNSMRSLENTKEQRKELSKGDLIVVKKVRYDSLREEDIITFDLIEGDSTSLLTHRIINIDTPIIEGDNLIKGITTKGDANNIVDKPIKREQIHGKVVFHVIGFGKMTTFIKQRIFYVVCVTLLFFVILKTLSFHNR